MMKINAGDTPPNPGRIAALHDGPYEIMALIEQDCRMQRQTCKAIKETFRLQRRQMLKQALRKMARAAWMRVGQAALNAASNVGQQVAAGQGGQAARYCKISGDLIKDLRPLGQLADFFDRRAQRDQLQSRERGEAAADLQPWLDGARELESKMIARLEELQRMEHDERTQAMGR